MKYPHRCIVLPKERDVRAASACGWLVGDTERANGVRCPGRLTVERHPRDRESGPTTADATVLSVRGGHTDEQPGPARTHDRTAGKNAFQS